MKINTLSIIILILLIIISIVIGGYFVSKNNNKINVHTDFNPNTTGNEIPYVQKN